MGDERSEREGPGDTGEAGSQGIIIAEEGGGGVEERSSS